MAADLLKDEEIKALIIKAQHDDQHARSYLVEKNKRLVWSIVNRYKHRGYKSKSLFKRTSA